ncbi:MAG TPA: hypothetical protein VJ652_22835 [Noviherbaspirillum sp.]|nr:hypothetical protein [Noviherbaspirillum sp.]
MTSFVDLMGNDVWSEADIVNRTEALVRSEFSRDAEMILQRKATGALLGQYVMTEEEQAELARFATVTALARKAGVDARADMALLRAALDVEAAQRRRALPVFDGPEALEDGSPNPAVQVDADERTGAQAVIDAAAPETLDLVAARAAQFAEVP